jgi:hypothetical protein
LTRRSDPTCGIAAEPMAYFMKDYIGATAAMEMDQGEARDVFTFSF